MYDNAPNKKIYILVDKHILWGNEKSMDEFHPFDWVPLLRFSYMPLTYDEKRKKKYLHENMFSESLARGICMKWIEMSWLKDSPPTLLKVVYCVVVQEDGDGALFSSFSLSLYVREFWLLAYFISHHHVDTHTTMDKYIKWWYWFRRW